MTYKIKINYHQHPLVGGVGHVSLAIEKQDAETVELSVYPSAESLLLPFSLVSFYCFPIRAAHHSLNHTESSADHSPVCVTYDVTHMVPYPEKAYEKTLEIRGRIDAGTAAFSTAPSWISRTLWHLTYAFTSPDVSLMDIHLGVKTFDPDLRQNQARYAEIYNCAEATGQVLEAGGLVCPSDVFGFKTPRAFHSFFSERLSVPVSSSRVVDAGDDFTPSTTSTRTPAA